MSALRYTHGQWWVALFLIAVWSYGVGRIEGMVFPAALPIEITETKETGTVTLFWGHSARLRPSCNFRSIEWFLGNRGQRNAPIEIKLGPSKVQPDGAFNFGPWQIETNAFLLQHSSFADVIHQCSTFGVRHPWLTRTRLWR